MSKELTDKESRFVQEYLVDLNATQAAIRAGYSEHSAKEIGYENLTKPHVSEQIHALQQERAERTKVTADRVIRELARIAFSDLKQVASWDEEGSLTLKPSDELDESDTASISEIQSHKSKIKDVETTNVRIKRHDKTKALEMLGRHLGLFNNDKSGAPTEVSQTLEVSEEMLLKLSEVARGKK